MRTKIIEATNGFNWGKFLVGSFDWEWSYASAVSGYPGPLLAEIGYARPDIGIWVLDLQTREGAWFKVGGYAKADLDKHRIRVCPLFEPFLTWLYENYFAAIRDVGLPDIVELPGAEAALHGYRRSGTDEDLTTPRSTSAEK